MGDDTGFGDVGRSWVVIGLGDVGREIVGDLGDVGFGLVGSSAGTTCFGCVTGLGLVGRLGDPVTD